MCRHLAYLGPAAAPAQTLFDAPHSLCTQAYAPVDMRGGGTVNVDGFGLGWFSEAGAPRRYRGAGPIWVDETLPQLAADIRTAAYVSAVRAATPGLPIGEAACAPFTDDGWLFSHNGAVCGWPDSMAALASGLDTVELLSLEASTDSALLWALLRTRLGDGQNPLEAVSGLVAEVEQVAPGSRLNLLLTDGEIVVATCWRHALWVRSNPDAVLVASEPCDNDPAWRRVADGQTVLARPGLVEFSTIAPVLLGNDNGRN